MRDQPDQPPLITIPGELDDKSAANLVHFLQGLTSILERYYAEPIARHYHRRNEALLELWDDEHRRDDVNPPIP